MAKRTMENIKLGIFVVAGITFLVLLLYVVGKNQDVFGNTFVLKARFPNVGGLTPGNSIRFAGIDAGTVKEVEVLNDSTIEATLYIRQKLKKFIHKNAVVTIGTDGLMGNKVVNIRASKEPSPVIEDGDVLYGATGTDTEEMLKVLEQTNMDIAIVATQLKQTAERINQGKALWQLLEDETLPTEVRMSLLRIRSTSENLNNMTAKLDGIVSDVKRGKGTLGQLLNDTSVVYETKQAIARLRKAGDGVDTLTSEITSLVRSLDQEINEGKGTVNLLLKDKEMADLIYKDIKNIEESTERVNEILEALKHSFLLRGYFRRQEQKKNK